MSTQPKPSATLKAVRGTRDLLPPETALWNRVESIARSVFARYGFGEIRTPIFEDTQLFARGVGEETDIVSKEMYTWDDRDRFDERRLRERWLEMYARDEYIGSRSNVKAGSAEIDLVAERRGVFEGQDVLITELVEFKPEVRQFDVDRLTAAVNHFKASTGKEHILGKLVVPEKRNTASSVKELQHGIFIEQLTGEFFLQSQRITLRPENTAGVVRAYIEHNLGDSGQLQKLFYIGPQFRRERPQRGRYRQFWQIGAEVLGPVSSGSESPLRDAEVLEMLASFLDELGIKGWRLELNSVGSAEDRKRYVDILRQALAPIKHQLCLDNQRRADTNPLRVLDSKEAADQALIDALPKIADYLDESSRQHFAQVCAALDACGVAYTVNPRLVRGLDYYTRTTFEFTVPSSGDAASGLGTQNALLGGGRYDGLSEMLGGPKAPGIGFAIGEDRLILTLQAQAGADSAKYVSYLMHAYIAPIGAHNNAAALALAQELRNGESRFRVEVGDGSFRLKKSFEMASKVASTIVIVGDDELTSNNFTVKTFLTGNQTKINKTELAAYIRNQSSVPNDPEWAQDFFKSQ
jgi:histidyl-tRNA synthetase